MASPRLVMVVPTYNEAENIEELVVRLRRALPSADVLVVDDCSPDGTGRVVDMISSRDPQVRAVHRAGKAGLGAAYLHGFAVALEAGYDVIGEMDADGSHQPEELPRLLAALEGADVVIGSRWVPGGSVMNWPVVRQLLSRGGNAYTRLLLGIPVRDATAGYRLFRREALAAVQLETVESLGYCFQVDLAWRAVRAGLVVREVPIAFVERERGESKMHAAIAAESLARITGWGARHRARQARGVLSRARSSAPRVPWRM